MKEAVNPFSYSKANAMKEIIIGKVLQREARIQLLKTPTGRRPHQLKDLGLLGKGDQPAPGDGEDAHNRPTAPSVRNMRKEPERRKNAYPCWRSDIFLEVHLPAAPLGHYAVPIRCIAVEMTNLPYHPAVAFENCLDYEVKGLFSGRYCRHRPLTPKVSIASRKELYG